MFQELGVDVQTPFIPFDEQITTNLPVESRPTVQSVSHSSYGGIKKIGNW